MSSPFEQEWLGCDRRCIRVGQIDAEDQVSGGVAITCIRLMSLGLSIDHQPPPVRPPGIQVKSSRVSVLRAGQRRLRRLPPGSCFDDRRRSDLNSIRKSGALLLQVTS